MNEKVHVSSGVQGGKGYGNFEEEQLKASYTDGQQSQDRTK
jgi:hypothetical protein